MSNNNPLPLLANHSVVVSSAVSGGGFYSRQTIMSTRFFGFFCRHLTAGGIGSARLQSRAVQR
jgi:hypothetical protein